MTCHYVTTLARKCGRHCGELGLCDFHAVLDAFEGQGALSEAITLTPVRHVVAARVRASLSQQAVSA